MGPEARIAVDARELVQLAIEIRERKRALFGNAFAADPAWDILLELYAAQLAGKRIRLDEFVDQYPGSVLARWTRILEEGGLVECQTDFLIPSALWLALTKQGALKMSEVFQAPVERS